MFLGNPHMFLAEEKWRKKIIGMKDLNPVTDQNTIDVEPHLGKVVQVWKCLQVNIYPEESGPYSFYNGNFTTGLIYPIMWAYEQETITQPLADEIINQLYSTLKFQALAVPIFVPIGAFFLLVGLFVLVVLGIMDYSISKHHYTMILNDE